MVHANTEQAETLIGQPGASLGARDVVRAITAQNWKNGGALTMDLDEAEALVEQYARSTRGPLVEALQGILNAILDGDHFETREQRHALRLAYIKANKVLAAVGR